MFYFYPILYECVLEECDLLLLISEKLLFADDFMQEGPIALLEFVVSFLDE